MNKIKITTILCVVAFAIVASIMFSSGAMEQPKRHIVHIHFIDGSFDVEAITYTNIQLNKFGCIEITTENSPIFYEPVYCGVRSFEIDDK